MDMGRDDVTDVTHVGATRRVPWHLSITTVTITITYLIPIPHSYHTMENPHAERQAVLLERIVKNTVRPPHPSSPHVL